MASILKSSRSVPNYLSGDLNVRPASASGSVSRRSATGHGDEGSVLVHNADSMYDRGASYMRESASVERHSVNNGGTYSRYGPNSPGSHVSASQYQSVERIVSIPFPTARSEAVDTYMRPDERDDIIRELRGTVCRLEKQVHLLEVERSNLALANQRLQEEAAELRREIARLVKLLEEERAMALINLSREETKRRDAFALVDMQRKLLLLKDEEIRQLSQLAAAHKEQIFVLHSHFGSTELTNILDDQFDVRRVDLESLDPESRQRITDLLKAQTFTAYFDTTVPHRLIEPERSVQSEAVYTADRSTAFELDAADGVLDGRFRGRDIMVPKETSVTRKSPPSDRASEVRSQLVAARRERARLGSKYRK